MCSLSEIPVTTALRARQGGGSTALRAMQRRQAKRKLGGDEHTRQPLLAKRSKTDPSPSSLRDIGNSSKQLSVTDFLERKHPTPAFTDSDLCVDLTEEAVNDFCDFDSEVEDPLKPDKPGDLSLTPLFKQRNRKQSVQTPPMDDLNTADFAGTEEPTNTIDADNADVATIDWDETPPLSPNPSHGLPYLSPIYGGSSAHGEQSSDVHYTNSIFMEDTGLDDFLTPDVTLLESRQVSLPSLDIDSESPSVLNRCVIKESCECEL